MALVRLLDLNLPYELAAAIKSESFKTEVRTYLRSEQPN
jgi:hypothetical protein